MTDQPKALFLADVINADPASKTHHDEAAAELRRLVAANLKLAGAIDMIRETLQGGNVDDLLYIINTALAEHRSTV